MKKPGTSMRERGMILLVVLWTLAVMSVVAVALGAYLQRNLRVASTDALQLRTELALRSGFNVAAARLWAMKPEEQATLLNAERKLDLGGGVVATAVISEATGRPDLNSADGDLLRNLFVATSGSEAAGKNLANAVLEARGTPRDATTAREKPKTVADASKPPGATDENGAAAEKPKQRGPTFQTPLQLQTLPGAKVDVINRILPFVGVVSKAGKVNVFSAPAQVLEAVPDLKRNDIAVIQRARATGDAKSEALKVVLDRFPEKLTAEGSRAFIVRVTLVSGPDIITGRSAFATILLTPDGAKPFQLLALSW